MIFGIATYDVVLSVEKTGQPVSPFIQKFSWAYRSGAFDIHEKINNKERTLIWIWTGKYQHY